MEPSPAEDEQQYTVTVTDTAVEQPFHEETTVTATGPVQAVCIAPISHREPNQYVVRDEEHSEERHVDDAAIREYIETAGNRNGFSEYMYMLYPVADRDDTVSRRVAEAFRDELSTAWVAYGDGTSYYLPATETVASGVREVADALFEAKDDYSERFTATVTLGIEVTVDPDVTVENPAITTGQYVSLALETDGEAAPGDSDRIPLGFFRDVESVEVKTHDTASTETVVLIEARVTTAFSAVVETESLDTACRVCVRDEVENQPGSHAATVQSVRVHGYGAYESPQGDDVTKVSTLRRIKESITSFRESVTPSV